MALLLALSAIAACSTSAAPKADRWVSSEAASCERLMVAWNLKAAVLQEIVGINFTPADDDADGEGQLQLSVMKCGASMSGEVIMEPTVVAYVMIPLAADSVPVTISGVSRDAWLSLPLTLVDGASAFTELFAGHGYVVMDTDISFATSREEGETILNARLQFENGSVSVLATARGEPEDHEITSALVGTGATAYAAFFGKETARRYSAVSATVKMDGETVLSDLNLSESPTMVLFDTHLVSDRIFWHETLITQ